MPWQIKGTRENVSLGCGSNEAGMALGETPRAWQMKGGKRGTP